MTQSLIGRLHAWSEKPHEGDPVVDTMSDDIAEAAKALESSTALSALADERTNSVMLALTDRNNEYAALERKLQAVERNRDDMAQRMDAAITAAKEQTEKAKAYLNGGELRKLQNELAEARRWLAEIHAACTPFRRLLRAYLNFDERFGKTPVARFRDQEVSLAQLRLMVNLADREAGE